MWNNDYTGVLAAILLTLGTIGCIPSILWIGKYLREINEKIFIIECPDCKDWEYYSYSMADRLCLNVNEKLPYCCNTCNNNWIVRKVNRYNYE